MVSLTGGWVTNTCSTQTQRPKGGIWRPHHLPHLMDCLAVSSCTTEDTTEDTIPPLSHHSRSMQLGARALSMVSTMNLGWEVVGLALGVCRSHQKLPSFVFEAPRPIYI